MNKQWAIGGMAIGFVLLCTAWAMGWFSGDGYSEDPVVAEAEALRDQVLSQDEASRKENRSQIRQAMEGMNEEQRSSFMERSMPMFVRMGAAQMENRFDEFLTKSPEEQRKEIDKKIDEQLARAKERAKNGEAGNRRGPPNMSPGKMDEFRKKMQDWTTPEQRAKFETVMGMYNDRREQRGLEPIKGPGGFR
jgi:hypothetical protein